MNDYINFFLVLILLQLASGLIVLTTGYSYSWGSGIYAVSDPWSSILDDIAMLTFWIVLDFIYVQSVRYNRKRKEQRKRK